MLIIVFALSYSSISLATIINIPDDYPTIQEGIDASIDGDTVLVSTGLYWECINFNGKNIVVASNYIFSLDELDIQNTIIDGAGYCTVVTFENGEDSTASITGFTLKNGHNYEGGGILCEGSSPIIVDNIIRENSASYNANGGGIHCSYSTARIIGNTIIDNSGCHGGGINSEYSDLVISNNLIADNEAYP
jgi:hypothetical protein